MTVSQETGSVFWSPATELVTDDKLRGKQYTADFGDGKLVLARADDDVLTIKDGDKYVIIQPKSNNYGMYYLGEIRGKKYFTSERTNAKGRYWLSKVAKDRPMEERNAPSPAAYGKRA